VATCWRVSSSLARWRRFDHDRLRELGDGKSKDDVERARRAAKAVDRSGRNEQAHASADFHILRPESRFSLSRKEGDRFLDRMRVQQHAFPWLQPLLGHEERRRAHLARNEILRGQTARARDDGYVSMIDTLSPSFEVGHDRAFRCQTARRRVEESRT
jgi:hypothetical protein